MDTLIHSFIRYQAKAAAVAVMAVMGAAESRLAVADPAEDPVPE